ncbi:MAG: rhodanese-like domain-containing protein [Firmicutes bacterium]|nr:rhodanese-like domain-containing protein [Bacillota bacterium]MBR5489475.1 rhodanese-like domain-containing protein [Bacillota bacterium]
MGGPAVKKFLSKYSVELLCVLLALAMMLSGCSPQEEDGAPTGETVMWKQVNMEEAMELMNSEENYIILDVRRADEFASGHIPGAVNLANEVIGEDDAAVEAVLPDREQMILVYCRSGNRSKQASQKLADLGYTNVVEFGGILDWPGEIEY